MSSRRSTKKPKYLGILRGLQNRTASRTSQHKTLQNLKKETPLSKIEIVEKTLRDNPLYAHLKLPKPFPNDPPTIANYWMLEPRELEFEIQTTIWQINSQKKYLLSAFSLLIDINELFINNKLDKSSLLLSEFRNRFGLSLNLLSKVSFLHHNHDEKEYNAITNSILNEFGVQKRNIIALSIYDAIGSEYSYRSLRLNTISYFAHNNYNIPKNNDEIYGYNIVRYTMYPYCWDRGNFLRILNTLHYSSLIDSSIFLLSHLTDRTLRESIGIQDTIIGSLDSELVEIWSKLSTQELPVFKIDDEPRFSDSHAFRRGLAFREINEFRRFRIAVDPYTRDPNDTQIIVSPRIERFAEDFFGPTLNLKDLTHPVRQRYGSLDKFDAQNSNVTSRTAALVRLLRSECVLDRISEDQLLTLLDTTLNVASLCTPDEIHRLAELNNESGLYRYIICAIVYDQTNRNIDRTRLANALQDVVISRCDGDIRKFANLLYASGTHIARHFYELCTDEFLGLLFRMYRTAIEVSEARATIQEWFGDKFDEPIAFERAKAIRLNRRLQLRRGQINDSRIFVDTLRFNQWIEENLYSSLAAGLSAIGDGTLTLNERLNLDNFAERRTPEGQLAGTLETTFSEFCKNANYGIDSYLGRRIRHGTLIGTMAGPIRKMLQANQASLHRINEQARGAVYNWLTEYENRLRRLATEELQIQSEQKPKGLIKATLLDAEKRHSVELALKRLIAVYNDHQTIPATSTFLIEICWQLLEIDLQRIKKRLQEHRTSWGRLSGVFAPAESSEHEKQFTSNFIHSLNQIADQQFALLTSWFAKPESNATSAHLSELIDVTIAEAREHRPNFNPEIKIMGSTEVEILGGTYHHLYDALSILMENAAQHGHANGKLNIVVDWRVVSTTQLKITFDVDSELSVGSKASEVKAQVDNALTHDPFRAMVQEGRSGLRKLKQMEHDLREIGDVNICIEDDLFKVSFSFNLFLSSNN